MNIIFCLFDITLVLEKDIEKKLCSPNPKDPELGINQTTLQPSLIFETVYSIHLSI